MEIYSKYLRDKNLIKINNQVLVILELYIKFFEQVQININNSIPILCEAKLLKLCNDYEDVVIDNFIKTLQNNKTSNEITKLKTDLIGCNPAFPDQIKIDLDLEDNDLLFKFVFDETSYDLSVTNTADEIQAKIQNFYDYRETVKNILKILESKIINVKDEIDINHKNVEYFKQIDCYVKEMSTKY